MKTEVFIAIATLMALAFAAGFRMGKIADDAKNEPPKDPTDENDHHFLN